MKTSNKALIVASSILASSQALAHTGHDHAASTSMLTHVAFYGTIAALLVATAFAAVKIAQSKK